MNSVLRLGIATVVSVLVVSGSASAQTPAPKPPTPAKPPKFVLYHVAASQGDKPLMPRELVKFSAQLRVVGKNRFRLLSKRPRKLTLKEARPFNVRLPNKIGTGSIRLLADGSVEVTLAPPRPKTPRDRVKIKQRVFPIILVNQKFKVGEEQYIFLLEKVAVPGKR